MLYFEDLTDDFKLELGSVVVTKESIIDFAGKYDPQKFHLDEVVATKMFGGLIASGWHTACLSSRLMVDSFLSQAACMGSPGFDQWLFLKPVYADDQLTGKLSIVSAKQSQSKPDRGLVKVKIEIFNGDSEAVLSSIANLIMACKKAA